MHAGIDPLRLSDRLSVFPVSTCIQASLGKRFEVIDARSLLMLFSVNKASTSPAQPRPQLLGHLETIQHGRSTKDDELRWERSARTSPLQGPVSSDSGVAAS